MASLFDIGKSGLNSYRQALTVTGQNIANLNTEGYKRREASLEEVAVAKGGITNKAEGSGSGVRVSSIRRSFDEFLLNKARSASAGAEASISYYESIKRLENVLLPGDNNLGNSIGRFYDSLQEIVAAPADLGPRTIALEQGRVLAGEFQQVAKVVDELHDGVTTQISQQLQMVNGFAAQLASLNQQLSGTGANSQNNSLLDKRDAIIDSISEYVGVSVELSDSGVASLTIGSSGRGPVLLEGNRSQNLSFVANASEVTFFCSSASKAIATNQVDDGSLSGLSRAYSNISDTMNDVDHLAFSFVQDMNALHSQGIDLEGNTGKMLFRDLDVNLQPNPANISDVSAEFTVFDHSAISQEKVVFTYQSENRIWTGRLDNGTIVASGRDKIQLSGLEINFKGQPENFDEVIMDPLTGTASGVSLAINRPQDFAAASARVVYADPSNASAATIEIETGAAPAASGLSSISDVFANNASSVAATQFMDGGAVAVIPAGASAAEFMSLIQQSSLRFTIGESELSSVSSLALEISSEDGSGNTVVTDYTFTLDQSNFDTDSDGWNSLRQIADLLNRGAITGADGSGNTFSLADLGGFASGVGGNLSINLSEDEFSSGDIGLTAGTTVSAVVKSRNETASDIQVFTREGRHIAGTALSGDSLAEWQDDVANGLPFNDGAEYRDDYLNLSGDEGYMGVAITIGDDASEILLDVNNKSNQMTILEPSSLTTGDVHQLTFDDGAGNVLTLTPSALSTIVAGDALQALYDVTQESGFEDLGFSFSYDTNNSQLIVSRDDLVDFSVVYKSETATFDDFVLPSTSTDDTDTFTLSVDGGNIVTTAAATYSSNTEIAEALQTALTTAGITTYTIAVDDDDYIVLEYADIANQTATAYALTYNGSGTGGSNGTGTILDGNDAVLSVSIDGGATLADISKTAVTSDISSLESTEDNSQITFQALDGIDTNELSPDGLSASAQTLSYSVTVGDLTATVTSLGSNPMTGSSVAAAIIDELRSNAPQASVIGLANLDAAFSFTLSDFDLDESTLHSQGLAFVEYLDETYKLTSDGSTVTVSGGPNFLRSLTYTSGTETVSGYLRELPDDGDEVLIEFESQQYTIAMEDGEVSISGGEADRLTVFIDGNNLLNIVSNSGTISKSDITIVDEADVSGNEDAAARFGLMASGVEPTTSFSDASYTALHFDIALDGDTIIATGSNDAEPPIISGTAQSLAGQRITLQDLPDEELIVFVGSTGAKRITAQYDLSPSETVTVPSDITIKVVDADEKTIEFIDTATGTSMATRQLDDLGQATALSLATTIYGDIALDDLFFADNNFDGVGDARAMQDLISLQTASDRSDGRGGFREMFTNAMAKLGTKVQTGELAVESSAALREASREAEAAYSGVNLDTEAALLIEQQQAYQASARVLSTARDLFETLIQSL